jgi:hypothetical protein
MRALEIVEQGFPLWTANRHKEVLAKRKRVAYLAFAAPQWRGVLPSTPARRGNDDDDIDDP